MRTRSSICLKDWLATGPVQGVYWLPALDHEGALLDMDLAGWREALRVRVKSLYATMRALYEQIAAPGTFLVSATRLGGQHGYDEAGAVAPLGGAVIGFTKAYKRERMEALVKAVDFELGREARNSPNFSSRKLCVIRAQSRSDTRAATLDRWPARTARCRRPTRLDLGQEHRLLGHRRGGKHRLGHHRRSGGSLRRHILPARSGAGARSRQS